VKLHLKFWKMSINGVTLQAALDEIEHLRKVVQEKQDRIDRLLQKVEDMQLRIEHTQPEINDLREKLLYADDELGRRWITIHCSSCSHALREIEDNDNNLFLACPNPGCLQFRRPVRENSNKEDKDETAALYKYADDLDEHIEHLEEKIDEQEDLIDSLAEKLTDAEYKLAMTFCSECGGLLEDIDIRDGGLAPACKI
jgi:predicted  nucleic acid-binding Zn-ribbon protein